MSNTTAVPSLVRNELRAMADKTKAVQLRKFFKTRKGDYAEGQKFLGVTMPDLHKLAKKYAGLITLGGVGKLMESPFHEVRVVALLMLVEKMEQASDLKTRQRVAECYIKNLDAVNNWDLVDMSAPAILGRYLFDKDRTLLYELAASDDLWRQRIALLATFYFIRSNQFEDTLAIAEMLLDSKRDLIQKSIGWMLREVGKRDEVIEKEFLDKYAALMPRLTLRYAIEKFSEQDKAIYMNLGKE